MSCKMLPKQGPNKNELLSLMEQMKEHDVKWQDGKVFSLVYHGKEEMVEVIKEAYNLYFSENGLNPSAFPSLKKFENDIVSMIANHLGGGPSVCGSMTSGGSESILMAVKTAREWGKKEKNITRPKMIMPISAHPAFDKAAHYFGIDLVKVPLREDFRVDVEKMQAAIDSNTILLVGSAPQYPQGVIDPIEQIALLAKENNILCHVDACIGGILLPFFRQLGASLPGFDFGVEGVSSISVDLHKYAYAAKGASVVLYKSKALRRHQFFVTTDWPGGMYASPTALGTRPGGAIAAAWAILNYLGQEGYLELVGSIRETTLEFVRRLDETSGVELAVRPDMSILCVTSDKYDIFQIGDEMTLKGWHMDRQQNPSSLHMTVTYAHAKVIDQFFDDLAQAIDSCRSFGAKMSGVKTSMTKGIIKAMPKGILSKLVEKEGKTIGEDMDSDSPKRTAAMYGMMEALPQNGSLDSLVLDVLDGLYTPSKSDDRKDLNGN